MAYTRTISANFGSYAPILADVRVDVNGTIISSGITIISNTAGTAFEVDVTLPDGFNGPFTFYDSTDPTKYCVGSVSPIFDHTSDEVITDPASRTASQADVATALSDIHLDHLLAADYDPADKPGAATALFNELIADDGGVSKFTTNALENAPTGGGGGGGDVNVVSVGGVAVDDPDDLKADVSGVSVDEDSIANAVAAQLAASNVDVSIASALSESADLTITKNETLNVRFTGLSIPANVVDVYFTIQENLLDEDSEAIVQIKDVTGLLRLNGEAASGAPGSGSESSDGSLIVDQPSGTIDLILTDDLIALIRARSVLHYDLKYITALGTSQRLVQRRVIVQWTPTKTI